jgi:hypothetical protein
VFVCCQTTKNKASVFRHQHFFFFFHQLFCCCVDEKYRSIIYDKTHQGWTGFVQNGNQTHHIGYFSRELECALALNKKCNECGVPLKNPQLAYLGLHHNNNPAISAISQRPLQTMTTTGTAPTTSSAETSLTTPKTLSAVQQHQLGVSHLGTGGSAVGVNNPTNRFAGTNGMTVPLFFFLFLTKSCLQLI